MGEYPPKLPIFGQVDCNLEAAYLAEIPPLVLNIGGLCLASHRHPEDNVTDLAE